MGAATAAAGAVVDEFRADRRGWLQFAYDLQPQSHFSTGRPIRRCPQDQYLPLATGLYLNVLPAGKGHLDAHPHPPGIMGTDKCRGVVRLDSLRDFGGPRNRPPFENAANPAARDILQSPVAYYCGVSTLVDGEVGGFTSGRRHLGVPVGDLTHRCRTVGVRVCELHLQTKEVAVALTAEGWFGS